MKSDNQAAVILFSDYSDMMLTDEELLSIHGGATDTGEASTSSTNAPPAAPPPAAPAQAPQVLPLTTHVDVHAGDSTLEHLTRAAGHVLDEAAHVIHDFHTADTWESLDKFVATAIDTATNSWFGESSGSSGSSGSGG